MKVLMAYFLMLVVLCLDACSVSSEEELHDSSYTVVLPRLTVEEVDPAVYSKTQYVYLRVIHYPQDTLFSNVLLFSKHEVSIPVKVASGNKIKYSIAGYDSLDNAIWSGGSEWVTVDGDTANIDVKASLMLYRIVEDIAEATDIFKNWISDQVQTPISNQYQQLRSFHLITFYADSTYKASLYAIAQRPSLEDTIFSGEETGIFSITAKFSKKSGSVRLRALTYRQCMDSLDLAENHCAKDSLSHYSQTLSLDTSFVDLFELFSDSLALTQDGVTLVYSQLGSTLSSPSYAINAANGDTLPFIAINKMNWLSQDLAYPSDSTNSWCYGDGASCNSGRLYDWASAKKACPAGWHLPTSLEWVSLLQTVGGTSELASAGTRLLTAADGGSDVFGFHARLGGYRRGSNGEYLDKGNYGLYWSSTAPNDTSALIVYFSKPGETAAAGLTYLSIGAGASVRCVQND